MAQGSIVRVSVEQANLPALLDAFGKLQALSPTDNRSWIYWAGIHGFPDYACWHHSRVDQSAYPYDLFLPWHRAYLLSFEHVMRDQNPDAVLPWWDWTSAVSHTNGVPESYAVAEVDGEANPLATGPMPDMPDDPARRTRRFPGPPDELPFMDRDQPLDRPRLRAINTLLGLTKFTDFTNQLQNVHDFMHGWCGGTNPADPTQGGDMGVIATSAFDPIFWAHHCMIDRLWYLWQLKNGVSNVPSSYLARPLAPFGKTVADVLDITQLGYEYATSTVTVAAVQ